MHVDAVKSTVYTPFPLGRHVLETFSMYTMSCVFIWIVYFPQVAKPFESPSLFNRISLIFPPLMSYVESNGNGGKVRFHQPPD